MTIQHGLDELNAYGVGSAIDDENIRAAAEDILLDLIGDDEIVEAFSQLFRVQHDPQG